MYIRKQPSGSTKAEAVQKNQGRGEYEISGTFDSYPPIKPAEIFNKELILQFGQYGFKATGNVLRNTGGKKRLRLLDSKRGMHIAGQVQAALLFPKSRRGENGLTGGVPVIVLDRYIVQRLHFRDLAINGDEANVKLSTLDLFNRTQVESIDFDDRMDKVRHLHVELDRFPPPLRNLLLQHREILKSPSPIPRHTEDIIRAIMDVTEQYAPDFNIDYVSGTDVLGPLNEILNEPTVEQPEQIELIDPEDVEIRLREAGQWRKLVAVRGPDSALFRRKVREAYRSTCIVCGISLPASQYCRVPGVDSAHILPWATHDLDIVGNGLCLCKLHHWAFDQQLVSITHENGEYYVTITPRAKIALDERALALLLAHEGRIESGRLPTATNERPRPQFLVELHHLLGEPV